MHDYIIICKSLLPLCENESNGKDKLARWETYSFGREYETYYLDKYGKLYIEKYDYIDISRPNSIYVNMKKTNVHLEEVEFNDIYYFHNQTHAYKVVFKNYRMFSIGIHYK